MPLASSSASWKAVKFSLSVPSSSSHSQSSLPRGNPCLMKLITNRHNLRRLAAPAIGLGAELFSVLHTFHSPLPRLVRFGGVEATQ
jgi:hypothetical protein